MGVSIGGAKKKFADIVDELHTEPPMMSQFAVWLDMKLAEYKLQGDMRLDYHECVSAPDWMKGSKCQCLQRSQYDINGKNQWMYPDTDMEMDRSKLAGRLGGDFDRAEFDPGSLSLEEFGDLDDSGKPVPDTTIDAQHPLVQLIRRKSRKKPAGEKKRGRPKGGSKEGTLTETGVRVKRVKTKRKEPDSFPESTIPPPMKEKKIAPATEGGPSQTVKSTEPPAHIKTEPVSEHAKLLTSAQATEFKGPSKEFTRPPSDFTPQPSELPRPSSEFSRQPMEFMRQQPPPELPRPSSEFQQKPSELPRQQTSEFQRQQPSEFQRQQISDFQRKQPPELSRPLPPDFPRPSSEFSHQPGELSDDIPDMSDDMDEDLLDSFNEDLDDCSFGSMTPPESPDQMEDMDDTPPVPHVGPGIPLIPPNVRQSFSKSHEMMADSGAAHYRVAQSQEKGPQAQTNPGFFRTSYPGQQETGPNPSQSGHHVPPHHTASPQTSVPQVTPQNAPPHTPISHQQLATQQIPTQHPSIPHQTQTQHVHSSSSLSPSFPQGQTAGQSSQGSSNQGLLRFDRNRTNLTAPQSLLRGSISDSSNDALKIGMDYVRDPFNDDFYDDDFGTATDEEDIIALESDEEAAHLAMLEEELDSPAGSLPDHLPSPNVSMPTQAVSDPENASLSEGAARKKRKYTRKDDGIKVPKDVRVAVHNVVKDLKIQDELLEWDYTKGCSDEWNRELNSKILSMVDSRLGKVDVDTCMKAINCYFISRRAQWRKQQNNPADEGKKKVKQKSKPEVAEPSSTQ